MEKKFVPDSWLAFLLENTLWHDFSNPDKYERHKENLLEVLEIYAMNAKMEEGEGNFCFIIWANYTMTIFLIVLNLIIMY